MALPVTISGADVGKQNSYHGPIKSSTGGSFYSILVGPGGATDDEARAFKATDPTSSFTEQDTANRPVFVNGATVFSMWSFQVGDNIHVFAQLNQHDVYYARFLTDDGSGSEDTWTDVDTGDKDILIDTTGTTQAADAVTGAVRSDGDIVVAYQGDSDMLMGTEFERIDWNVSIDAGKTWAGPVSIDNGGKVNWTGCVIVPGKDDRMHVFFQNRDLRDAFQRRINSDDSLETFPSAFDSAIRAISYPFGHGVSYDDGGTQRVRCVYHESAQKISIAKCDSIDTPIVTIDEDISENSVVAVNDALVSALSVDTKNLQVLYSGGGSGGVDKDLYRDQNDDDAGWGTDTEERDAETYNHISSKVYERAGTKRLAMILDNGGTVQYDEIDLAAVVIPTIHLVMAPPLPGQR